LRYAVTSKELRIAGRTMAITDWPPDDRPREKLLHRGADSLSDAELVAIFLRTGVRGKSAVDVAREALTRFGSLSGLFAARQQWSEQSHCDRTSLDRAR